MAIMSEMDAALKALLEYSEGIQETVRGIRALMSGGDGSASKEEARTAQREKPAEEPASVEPEKVYTLQEVRAMLKAKTDQGYRTDVKALLKAHGAERLPDIDPKEYPAMMKEAEGIGA